MNPERAAGRKAAGASVAKKAASKPEKVSRWKSSPLRVRQRILAKLRERYATDKKFREKAKKTARKRYHKDPEYRKATLERAKARYRAKKAEAERTGA